MYKLLRRQEEDGFLVAKLSIDQAHRELGIEVREAPDASHLKVDFMIGDVAGDEALYLADLDAVRVFCYHFLKQFSSFPHTKDGLLHLVVPDANHKLVANL